MDYAIIRFGGKQFKVEKGSTVKIERQESATVEVLLYADGNSVLLGDPVLTGYSVDIEKVEDKRDSKIRVGRFKAKSRYRKVNGHRQPISIFKINDVIKGKLPEKDNTKPAETPKVEEAKVEVKTPKKEEKVKKTPEAKAEKKTTKSTEKKEVKADSKKVESVPKKRGRPKKEQK